MKNFVSPHVHQGSLDTGSTPAQFLTREMELGTGFTTVTDHGTLQVCRDVYDLAKKKGYTAILGLEAYFRDDDCPILKAAGIPKARRYRNQETGKWLDPEKWKALEDREKVKFLPEEGFWNYWKYAHLTMHFQDAKAYETAVRLLSQADARAEQHGSERKPLFGWAQLEELGSKNVVFASGCLIGMVQRHLMAQDNVDMAWRYYERLRSLVKPGNFYVEVFPHICTHFYQDKVVLTYEDGTEESFPSWKKLKTNVGPVEAKRLADVFPTKGNEHHTLYEVMQQRRWVQREGRVLKGVRRDEGFVENDCHPWSTSPDVQKDCNRFVLALADAYKDPVLVSDDSHYALPDEKIVQEVRLAASGGWRFFGHYHRQSSEEAYRYFHDELGVEAPIFEGWVENSYSWAEKFKTFSFKQRLSLPTRFYPQETLAHAQSLILKHGRMRWGDPRYEARLASELKLLHLNGTMDLLPYFFVAEEVCAQYEKAALLTGPGRGSAAGLLFSYLLGITHVDPLKYGLSQERFLTLDRIKGGKLPDIDQDLPGRDLLIDPEKGWLRQRFGDCFAQISTDTKLKLRSSVKDVARMKLGFVPEDIEALAKNFAEAPQGIEHHDFVHGYEDADGNLQPGSIEWDEALKEYIRSYPEHWKIVDMCLGIPRQKSRHACGYVITNEPVSNFIPLTSVGDVTVTQYTAKSVEAVGGLKMDYLVVNSLNDIADCIKLIQEHQGYSSKENVYLDGLRVPWFRIIPYKGKLVDVWDLPQEQPVFRDICEGRTETVFQFNTSGVKKWLREFDSVRYVDKQGEVHKALDTDEALAALTALDRPGPLDYYVGKDENGKGGHNMLVEYARRASGKPSTGALPILDRLLPETFGVIVYQEQLQYIFQEVGHTTPMEADAFRTHISKKEMEKVYKDKAIFMRGAVKDLGEEVANTLWSSMETFGKYGFNKSHAVCYAAKIGYACAWLKHNFPLQWWCAVLRNADKNEVNEEFWPYCGKYVLMPDVAKSGQYFQVEGDHIRAPINLLQGIGEKAHQQLLAGFPYRDIEDFCQKIQAHREATSSLVTVKVVKKKPRGSPPDAPREFEEVQRRRLGRSALTRKVVYTLIQAGVMDSLFPEDIRGRVGEQINALETALYKATKKKPKKVGEKYFKANSLATYQMRKAVLPVYSEDLVPHLLRLGVKDVYKEEYEDVMEKRDLHLYTLMRYFNPKTGENGYTKVVLVDGPTLRFLSQPKNADKGDLVAVVGYVKASRKFNYPGGQQGTKEALEVVLDVGGFDFKFVRWSGRTGRLESKYTEQPLTGGIVIAVVTKFNPQKSFVIEDLRIIQEPLGGFPEEESSSH